MINYVESPIVKVILGYALIAFFAVLPILISIIAGLIGNCLGCNINEAGTDECIRFGIPFGKILNPLAVVGWFSLITLPIAAIAFIVWSYMSYQILTK